MTGITRNITNKVNKLLKIFPAVIILGARQAGKTTLAKQIAPDSFYLDFEKNLAILINSNKIPSFFSSSILEILLLMKRKTILIYSISCEVLLMRSVTKMADLLLRIK